MLGYQNHSLFSETYDSVLLIQKKQTIFYKKNTACSSNFFGIFKNYSHLLFFYPNLDVPYFFETANVYFFFRRTLYFIHQTAGQCTRSRRLPGSKLKIKFLKPMCCLILRVSSYLLLHNLRSIRFHPLDCL